MSPVERVFCFMQGTQPIAERVKRIAIITGASQGLGKEFAVQFDALSDDIDELWLIARNKKHLDELALRLKHTVRIFSLDLCEEKSLEYLKSELDSKKYTVATLINNAGMGANRNFKESSWQYEMDVVLLNCRAPLALTFLCLPHMAKGSGIIQVASVAAFLPQPRFANYAASKSYLLSFSRALHEELKPHGIVVTTVCPNAMATPFWGEDGFGENMTGFKKAFCESPQRVVRTALAKHRKGKAVSISARSAYLLLFLTKIIPQRLILAIIRKSNI